MKLFIYEHLTSGALAGQHFSTSLLEEGDAMLLSVTQDLAAFGYDLTILRDHRLPEPSGTDVGQIHILWIENNRQYSSLWQQILDEYNYFLIIAPETDNTLSKLAGRIRLAGKMMLGCDSQSISICTNKDWCARQLERHQIPGPATWLGSLWLKQFHQQSIWLVKPRDGAGSEDTFVLDTKRARQQLCDSRHADAFIVQPYIEGQVLSISLFITQKTLFLLSVNRQIIELNQSRLSVKHCIAHANTPLSNTQAKELANNIVKAIPGLWGFVGIDLIWTKQQCWVIDINPRLTSSYVHASMRRHFNPAQYLHDFLQAGN